MGPQRIHITGSPRSGTTLFLSLLMSCFDIDGGVAHELRLKRTPPKASRTVCTKFPNETDFACRMLRFDPNLHVVFMLRDPRDVIVSKSHLGPGAYLTNLRVWRENLAQARPWFGHSRFHVVFYRGLVTNPDQVQARLAERMPFLTATRQFSQFTDHAREQGGEWLNAMHMKLRPVGTESWGNWRHHLERLKGQMFLHGDISHDLIEFGFAKDKAWLSLLDEIEPDLDASATRERDNLGRHVTRAWRNATGMLVYLLRLYLGVEVGEVGEKPLDLAAPGLAQMDRTSEQGIVRAA